MDKWEYKKVSSKDLNLNKLGEEGWEMCGVEVNSFSFFVDYYFKRKKEA
ncbi:MAG TPA: hypothetical protein VF360_00245 [Candidatus Methanoperedens sp.]